MELSGTDVVVLAALHRRHVGEARRLQAGHSRLERRYEALVEFARDQGLYCQRCGQPGQCEACPSCQNWMCDDCRECQLCRVCHGRARCGSCGERHCPECDWRTCQRCQQGARCLFSVAGQQVCAACRAGLYFAGIDRVK